MNFLIYLVGAAAYHINNFISSCAQKYEIHKSLSKIHAQENVAITSKVSFSYPRNIYVGRSSYINGGDIIAGLKSKIIIGDNCLISYNVHIRTSSHNYDDLEIPINKQGMFEKDIIIGNNVWIGYGVQILPGVIIGDNSIIGAGSLVTKNIPENEIWGGVPARSIKKRG